MEETTFVLIKPNVMKKGKSGAIVQKFQDKGLKVVGMKMIRTSKNLCETFYEEHSEKAFFKELVGFISSAPVVILAL